MDGGIIGNSVVVVVVVLAEAAAIHATSRAR